MGFLLGLIVDIILVPTGVWRYGNPTIFKVPIWIPLSYGLFFIVFIKIGKSFVKLVLKTK